MATTETRRCVTPVQPERVAGRAARARGHLLDVHLLLRPGPGRLTEAELTFQKMFTYANHLGLYSEEIGLTGEQLGNFPQAFSHDMLELLRSGA